QDFCDGNAFTYDGAVHAGAFNQCHRNVDRVSLTIFRKMKTADEVFGNNAGIKFAKRPRADDVDVNAKDAGHLRSAGQLLKARRRVSERYGLVALVSRRLAGFGLELLIETMRVGPQLRHILCRPKCSDEAGCMPGRPACEPIALEEQDIGHTTFG